MNRRLYMTKVEFVSLRPRLRFNHKYNFDTIEFIWLGLHFDYFCVGSRPICLLKGGKHIQNDFNDDKRYRPATKGLRQNTKFHELDTRSYIPDGIYCHWPEGRRFICPYWDCDLARPEQSSGYCHLINAGDWDKTMLLWDQCKECGYNEDEENPE
jgi:hypothetical protein